MQKKKGTKLPLNIFLTKNISETKNNSRLNSSIEHGIQYLIIIKGRKKEEEEVVNKYLILSMTCFKN